MPASRLFQVLKETLYATCLTQRSTDFSIGSTGLLLGGAYGIIRSQTPALFAIASGFQWFALGSTYAITRAGISHAWNIGPTSSPNDKLKASAAAGGVTGGFVGGVIRGRRNIIPGTIMFTIFGYLGQHIYNRLDERHTQQITSEVKHSDSLWKRMVDSKWSPMKILSDEDHANMLDETLLRVQAEIAIIDDDIEKLKAQSTVQDTEEA